MDKALNEVGNFYPLVGRQWLEAMPETVAYPDTTSAKEDDEEAAERGD